MNNAHKRSEPCHFKQLFVSHTGDVFPCCRVWNRRDKKIGHITDPQIIYKIENFDLQCECDAAKLTKRSDESFTGMQFETSLAYNAACAINGYSSKTEIFDYSFKHA